MTARRPPGGTRARTLGRLLLGVVGLLVATTALVAWLNLRDDAAVDDAGGSTTGVGTADTATIARGADLARIGNCAGCHDARGEAPYAGGRGIETPFGTVVAPNLTPDPDTGLGRWSTADFWRALHRGRSRDGRLLAPAFPYPNFTLVTRRDADAIFAFLRTVAPVRRPNAPSALRFPYGLQPALAVWRALYFRPGVFVPDPAQSTVWNRGAYLVRGLGHCGACHSGRNLLGATTGELAGGTIPMQDWVAPSLGPRHGAGSAGAVTGEIVGLLKNGLTPHAAAMGPMAEVVFRSTQYLRDDDLAAIAGYLRTLPADSPPAPARHAAPAVMATGGQLYADRCAVCHGGRGDGIAGAYPALAGNRAVTLASPVNLVKAILAGGFPPTTASNPRPFGMPPFGATLNDEEVAAVATYVRQAWGDAASPVDPLDVRKAR